MPSEVTNDLGIKLSGLYYLCSHAFLGSKCLYSQNERGVIIIRIPAFFAAGKNKFTSARNHELFHDKIRQIFKAVYQGNISCK